MGELGVVRRYAYWADRRVRELASSNGIALEQRISWRARSASIPFLGSLEFAQEARTLDRARVAEKMERAIGARAVEDFVTPPAAEFAKGIGHIEFAQLAGVSRKCDGVVLHTTARSSEGTRVDVCLFGSLDNSADYVGGSDQPPAGWTSSAAQAVDAYIKTHGQLNESQWDDDQAIAVEAVKIATSQGVTGSREEHDGKPWTRGWTLGNAAESEWFAQVYSDVVLDKNRWRFRPEGCISSDTERILIGAPLWVRTPGPQAVTRYRDLRRAAG